jgi:DNA-binding helix-hairpin-helix protein with protein kinase domain
MARYFDSSGRPLEVTAVLGRGGEGTVFRLESSPDLVAKIYSQSVHPAKLKKLEDMVRARTPALNSIAAWPYDLLRDRPKGNVVGFTMPNLSGFFPIHKLYSPAHRKQDFPTADWAFLVHAARNFASAVGTIHACGHIIGDINQGNIVVSEKAIVRLIDCDSMQVRVDGQLHLCEVGVAHFTAPELQNQSFNGIRRSKNHDNFGLAIVCFHLLFMGRHPFAGRFHGSGDMPIEKAIHEFRYAFGEKASSRQMEPPPNSLPINSASKPVAELFERAFSREGALTDTRPTAYEWVSALEQLERDLATCSIHPIHKYHRSLRDCSWCQLERSQHIYFFLIPLTKDWQIANFDLTKLWNVLNSILIPQPIPLPSLTGHAIRAEAVPIPLRVKKLLVSLSRGVLILATVVAFFGFRSPWGIVLLLALTVVLQAKDPLEEERQRRKSLKEAAERDWNEIFDIWQRQSGNGYFKTKKLEIERKGQIYMGLGTAYQNDLKKLDGNRRDAQLRVFLKRYFIDSAKIPGFGLGRKALLVSYGVETAADLTMNNLLRVPGIGQKRATDLMAWRSKIETKFIFDPKQGVTQSEILSLRQEYLKKQRLLQQELETGVRELEQLAGNLRTNQVGLRFELNRRAERHAQASADLEAIGKS